MTEKEPIKTRRGVYLDLTQSPYEYRTPYGDLFKFSSAKKLEIYSRDVVKELDRINATLNRNQLSTLLPREICSFINRMVYKAFYRKIEG